MYGGSGDALAMREEARLDARDRSVSQPKAALLAARLSDRHKDLVLIEDEMLPGREARIGETKEHWDLLVAEHDRAWADILELESQIATSRIRSVTA